MTVQVMKKREQDTGGVDHLRITLAPGKRAILIIPTPLSKDEKARLKLIIDLLLESEGAL